MRPDEPSRARKGIDKPSFRLLPPAVRRWVLRTAAVAAVTGAVSATAWLPVAPAAAALLASPGAVTTVEGQVYEGQISEREGDVVIEINGIRTVIPRDRIQNIEYGTPEQRFQRKLEQLPADDVQGRLALARQALADNLLDSAETAVESVLEVDPANREAEQLRRLIERQREIQAAANTGDRGAAPGGPTGRGAPNGGGGPRQRTRGEMVTDAQINRIRQLELQTSDEGDRRYTVRVGFQNNVLNRYVDSQNNLSFREFNRLSDVQKALAILENGSDEMKQDVVVRNDPISLLNYRRTIQPILLNGCATTACHGSSSGGSFQLFTQTNDAATYSNFYNLATYSTQVGEENEGSVFGGPAMRKLIDRQAPERSLLVSFALPRELSEYDHPVVGNYNGIFAGRDDVNYQRLTAWMGQSLRRIEPDYSQVDYTPPGRDQQAATQPAAE